MYLFSTFSTNTNFILNKKKEYKELVYKAEEELNLELDKIKKGEFTLYSKEKEQGSSKFTISKKIDVVDKNRGLYMVTVYANKGDEKIQLKGYERYSEEKNTSFGGVKNFE